MNSEQNVVNTEPYQEQQDTSGLVEIQQALEESRERAKWKCPRCRIE